MDHNVDSDRRNPAICTLPSEILVLIMEKLSSALDLRNFIRSNTRANMVFQNYKRIILESCIRHAVHPSNMDAILVTHYSMRHGLFIETYIRPFQRDYANMSPREALRVVKSNLELWDILTLATIVNRLCLLYSYPDDPWCFWKIFSYRYADHIPEVQLSSVEDWLHPGVYKLVDEFWAMWDAVYNNTTSMKRRCPESTWGSLQRDLICVELQSRARLIQLYDGHAGQWVETERPCATVQRFLHVLEDSFFATYLQSNRSAGLSSIELLGSNDWADLLQLGLRLWMPLTHIQRAGVDNELRERTSQKRHRNFIEITNNLDEGLNFAMPWWYPMSHVLRTQAVVAAPGDGQLIVFSQ